MTVGAFAYVWGWAAVASTASSAARACRLDASRPAAPRLSRRLAAASNIARASSHRPISVRLTGEVPQAFEGMGVDDVTGLGEVRQGLFVATSILFGRGQADQIACQGGRVTDVLGQTDGLFKVGDGFGDVLGRHALVVAEATEQAQPFHVVVGLGEPCGQGLPLPLPGLTVGDGVPEKRLGQG
jgi:hypothetical protein